MHLPSYVIYVLYICVIYVCYICICVSGKWWWTGVWVCVSICMSIWVYEYMYLCVCMSIASVSFMVLTGQSKRMSRWWPLIYEKNALIYNIEVFDNIKASFDTKVPWPSHDFLPHIYNFTIKLVHCMLDTGTGTDAFLLFLFHGGIHTWGCSNDAHQMESSYELCCMSNSTAWINERTDTKLLWNWSCCWCCRWCCLIHGILP